MTMEMALGMSESDANAANYRGTDQGVQMKSCYGWYDDLGGNNGTNSSGFSGLPGGMRGTYSHLFGGHSAYWWSSSAQQTSSAWYRVVSSFNEDVFRNIGSRRKGFSVRCIQDSEE